MNNKIFKMSVLTSLVTGALMAAPVASMAADAVPSALPKGAPFPGMGQPMRLGQSELLEYKALPGYHQPEWMDPLVEAGKLPPVAERLPKEPLVYLAGGMPDGIGQYGGVFRMVSGGRPEGWNWVAGKSQGWGGISYTVAECLTRTGPLTTIKKEEQLPLPNLAKRWEWSEDGRQLTMHLIEGARWSDGEPFTSEDVMFMWNDNILDPNIATWSNADTFGEGTKLEALDDYTIRWTFADSKPVQQLYNMAFFKMCPGPAHVLKPLHPKYNKDASYQNYVNALSPDAMPVVTMGAWAPVYHKADQLLVMRRNPYFWKVDEAGNQLPYMDELQFKLSTWPDREVQTVSGNADYANMENPANYVEAIKKSRQPDSPARLDFSPRLIGWSLFPNFSEALGTTDTREKAIRKLNRELKFRQAISHAVDRNALGQALVRGPFSRPFAGGLYTEGVADDSSAVFYGYNPEVARQLLADLGLQDTDGNGILNWTAGPMKGKDLEIAVAIPDGSGEPKIMAGLISQLREVGIQLISRPLAGTQFDSTVDSGAFDWMIRRSDVEKIQPIANITGLAPFGPSTPRWHKGTESRPQKLLPFEKELVETLTRYRNEPDMKAQLALLNQYNKVATENLYEVGLTSVPAALIINKRIMNVPPGTPILSFQWAEDAIMRERLWIDPKAKPVKELMPDELP